MTTDKDEAQHLAGDITCVRVINMGIKWVLSARNSSPGMPCPNSPNTYKSIEL